jgi:hypothetical protein
VIRFTEVAIGIALQGHVTGRAPQIEVNEVTMSALSHKMHRPCFVPLNSSYAKNQAAAKNRLIIGERFLQSRGELDGAVSP